MDRTLNGAVHVAWRSGLTKAVREEDWHWTSEQIVC